jgi:TPR repeat protein
MQRPDRLRSAAVYLRALATGLGLCALFFDAYAEAPSNIAVHPKQKMETDTATAALTLIRQRKFEEARTLLLTSAEKGDAASQGLLGQMYNAGWGIPVDYKEAFKWWSHAVAGGSTDALWGLGLLYDEGNGVARDSKKAAELWKQGSEQGNIKATVNLAFLYEEGRGVQRDLKECARLFKIAAEAGEPAAQLNYGLKILHGEGVEQNEILGAAWLGVAAESPRFKGTPYAEKMISQRAKTWATLSATDREKAAQLMQQIQSRIKAD